MNDYSNEELFSVIEDEANRGTDLRKVLKECKFLCMKYKSWESLWQNEDEYFIGKEFTVDSDSWQVRKDNAKGQYIILEKNDEYRGFVCQNQDTKKKYLIDKECLTYLMTYEGNQDYKFIYIGFFKDMNIISL